MKLFKALLELAGTQIVLFELLNNIYYITLPVTCTMMFVVELNWELLPIHVYTPSFVGYCALTICRVDMTLPKVISLSLPRWGGVTTSVWLNVLELLNVHLTVGVGPPTEVQLMLTLFPSKTATFLLLTEVFAVAALNN